MPEPAEQVLFPSNFLELFSIWNRFPHGLILAGGLEQIRNQGKHKPVFPENIISLSRLEELRKISRSERYLEIGAMVNLNQILHLGKIVPEPLVRCLELIGGPQLRNIATIGGNICHPLQRLDASGPMIALDAQYELRTAQSARWVPASMFSSLPGPPALTPRELLTRIRVPLEPWTYTWYRKFNTAGSGEAGGGILFMIRNEKNILTNIRVVYSGLSILREKNSETMLEGKRLPLDKKDAVTFTEKWKTCLSAFKDNEKLIFSGAEENSNPELVKAQIMNFIETAIMRISD